MYNYQTLIEPVYDGNSGTAVKTYKLIAQDSSFPYELFRGTLEDCMSYKLKHCKT